MPTKLGQNFLKDKSVVSKIISAANLKADDVVLEIGPGEGILTEALAERAGKVLAIEIDKMLSNKLLNKFSNRKNVEIINKDILKLNISEIIYCHSERSTAESKNLIRSLDKLGMTYCNYKVIANLPYYITSPIIRMFLETESPPKEMVLMVQKEVAERIVEKPGKMSILAVSVQYYARPELLFYVSKSSFEPAPEVDSAVIKLVLYAPSPARGEGWGEGGEKEFKRKFFRVVRAGFSAKRKKLSNNLANSLHLDKNTVEERLKKAEVSPAARAQELSIDDWKKLTKFF